MQVEIPLLPPGIVVVSSIEGISDLAAQNPGGVVFHYRHRIQSSASARAVEAEWFLVPYAGMWFGFLVQHEAAP